MLQKTYRMKYQLLGLVAAGLSLTSCGFTPLYGNSANKVGAPNVENMLREVKIETIANYEGQYLRNELIDRLHNSQPINNSRYSLHVRDIQENIKDLDINKASNATLAQLRVSTRFYMKDNKSGEQVVNKHIWSTSSYNILDSQFTTRVSKNYARDNALKDLAAQIERQLGLYFRNQDKYKAAQQTERTRQDEIAKSIKKNEALTPSD